MSTSFKVADIKCTELLNLEKKGAIDPFVIFQYLGIEKKTEKKDNELNPTYGEVFDFDLAGKSLGPEDVLEVTVKDHEKIGRNRLVGVATISLTPCCQSKAGSTELSATLNDKNGRPTTGKITFRVEYTPPEGAQGQTGGGGDDRQNAAGEIGDGEEPDEDPNSMPDGTPIPPGPEGDAMRAEKKAMKVKRKRKPHGLPDKPTDFQIRVKIIEGRHLPGGNINPTVRVSVGDEEKQTRVKHSTNKPFFDETFFFNFNERPNELFDQIMKFQVFNAKGLLSDSLVGTFEFDVGTIYDQTNHAIIRKWLLMTAPEDNEDKEGGDSKGASAQPGGPPAGYVKITAFVLGPGDEIPDKAKGGGKADDEEDIESNLLRPAGATLRPATFLVKIYRAEDLPQMDSTAFDGVKKLFSSAPKDHCDPYFKFSFAGKTAKTEVKYANQNPEFNKELRVGFKFPSMCERLKIQFYDWDRLGSDDCIGTAFIPLSAISGNGDDGFLPAFGPCFVNFYGSLREFSDLPDEYDDLNKGRGEGVAYRGRALVEIDTRFGDLTKKPIQDIMAQELIRVQTYMRRRKYKLFASFLSANLISESDGPVEFEVSIGNYGNKLDSSVAPQSSSTPPTNPVFDGGDYYYLPWNETKPCCVIESHWEDIAFRLEPINCLFKIIRKLEKNIKSVELGIKAKSQPAEIAALLIALLDQLIADCRIPLPSFDTTMNGVNELDLKVQETRRAELSHLVDEATTLREQATDIHEAMEVISGYLRRLGDLCIEPQNSMPDVVVSMISGSKRIAYSRIPAYEIMYSKNPNAKGVNCAKLQNIIMKYPGKKGADVEDHPEIPASLNVIFWLGLEGDQADWTGSEQAEGEYSVYAETYENQIDLPIVDWTSKGCPRPAFSDSEGDIRLNKEFFVPPKGWKWDDPPDGEWFVDPELSANFDADAGHKTFIQDCFENESCVPGGNWGTSTIPYTNIQGDQIDHRDETQPPEGWNWTDDWKVDVNRACDEEGWEYCVEASLGGWGPVYRSYHLCRRRRFVRSRVLEQDPEKLRKKQNEDAKKGEGWEYAPVFGMKYHQKERKLDMVRRRRWHRKMVNTEPGAPAIFSVPNDDKDKPPIQIMPRIFLAYDAPHKWQMRAYLYQARDILGLDSEGISDAYAKVSFQNQSQRTRVVMETLCPDWDQTLLFEEMNIFGSPNVIAGNSPYVSVELFDKDKVGKDEYLGRALVQPLVRLNGSKPPAARLMWYPIQRGDRECGQLLAAFELFLDEGADLPFPPPMKENRYIVPNGIRPVMVRTGVEILCWGVRNMKKYQLASCTSPSVLFEIGGHCLTSDVIKNTKKNPNFSKNTFYKEIYLPKDPLYMPPVNIKVRDHRTFGRKPIVGRHVINSIDFDPPPPADAIEEYKPEAVVDGEEKKDVTLDIEEKKKKKEQIIEKLDWWSKYFASIGETSKCGDFLEKGHPTIAIYRQELEEIKEFGGFGDFVKSYPLERGKEDDDEDDNVVGEFKGLVKVYPLPPDPNEKLKNKYFSKVKDSKPVDCIIRVYIIRGIELQPKDPNGKADPYVVVELGKKKISDKENYIPNDINPYFGAYFELRAKIPITKDLKVRVMDYDLLGRNDLIGETIVDLENRYLSKARASCGLPPAYYTSGPYQWRDCKSPKEVLERLCRSKPQYLSPTQVVVNGKLHKLEDFEEVPPTNPQLGPPDQRLALYVLHNEDIAGMKLVPEHIETRSLRNPLQPNMDQGQLEMFVDIFPVSDGPPGPPLNITPRKPKDYVLRVIIWNTADVPPDETSITGEEMSDLYVKGWMDGDEDNKEKTDVHYRSMDGEGMFNWRMLFPFRYMPEEKVMVVEKKEHFWSLDTTKQTMPPKLNIQVWDNDLFSANDFIGNLEIDISKLPRPEKAAKKCTLAMLESEDTLDLFEAKISKGWWIMVEEQEDGTTVEKGKVEMTLEIVTEQEAELRPAGSARDEPNMNPKLEEPKRPDTSFLWFTSPWKTLKYIIWKNYKWYIIGFLLFIIIAALIIFFIYSLPGYSAKRLLGA